MFVLIFLSFQIIFGQTFKYEKPVAEKVWSVRCKKNEYVLNDCNWCWCGQNHHYQCKARVCEEVDAFGHFKDTIQEVDVGMEGHGTWRSRPTSCTPGVQYQRDTILCICDVDGNWPNPICRDLFRILHSVEVTEKLEESTLQTCSPTKLYLVGCNTCFCPSSGKLDANLCTNRTCSDGDPVLESKNNEKESKEIHAENVDPNIELNDNRAGSLDSKELIDDNIEPNDAIFSGTVRTATKELAVYAPCNTQKTYTIGEQICECLTNNRLICKTYDDNTTRGKTETGTNKDGKPKFKTSICSWKTESLITKACNICKCTKNGYMYCTVKKCMHRNKALDTVLKKMSKFGKVVKAPIDDLGCIPGTAYKRGCNKCYCKIESGKKIFVCTVKACRNSVGEVADMVKDCVPETTYETDCYTCSCGIIYGEKYQACTLSSRCWRKLMNENRTESLDTLHGYCEPRRQYKNGCNTCRCMSDGKIVICTTRPCIARSVEPVELEIVPLQQAVRETCPKGHSYKIDCNLCFCLSNGNALCTTLDCSEQLD